MATVVKSTDENTIALPEQLMAGLGLSEGDEVRAVLDGETIRFARLNEFLALRGALAHDQGFDDAMQQVSEAWELWKLPDSA